MEKKDLKYLFLFFIITFILIAGGILLFSKDAVDPEISKNIYSEKNHVLGSKDAKVVIVEFSDFECPACVYAERTVEKIMDRYQGKVKFIYRHFPLSTHTYSEKAAEAAEAAGGQGKFWEMKKIIFENQKELKPDDLKKYAQKIGLDMEKFEKDLSSGKYKEIVEQDKKDAQKLGLKGTPTFFINGEEVFDTPSFENLQPFIEKNL